MFPDSPWAIPKGSFNSPVLPPTFEPDVAPFCTVSINAQWVPYVIGCLQQLLLQSTWKTDDPEVLRIAQGRAANLISLFDCGGGNLPFGCDGVFATSSDPFSIWSIAFSGVYTFGYGYEGSGPVSSSGFDYWGLEVTVDFTSPIDLNGISMVYDEFAGNVTAPSGNAANYIYDDTHSALLWSINYGALANGYDQTMLWSGAIPGVSRLRIGLYPEAYNSGSHSGAAAAALRRILISGSGPVSPCP